MFLQPFDMIVAHVLCHIICSSTITQPLPCHLCGACYVICMKGLDSKPYISYGGYKGMQRSVLAALKWMIIIFEKLHDHLHHVLSSYFTKAGFDYSSTLMRASLRKGQFNSSMYSMLPFALHECLEYIKAATSPVINNVT
ncbi:hypothetical protein AMTRI_Chr13g122430 [Amborella trichopoda]